MELIDRLTNTDARVVYFPVRHHSPTCARLVGRLISDLKPDAVLIEGPSDFNDEIDQLHLDHELPIAIYSYVRQPDGSRTGAYYPFCDYSPEWVALRVAKSLGAEVHFIDLPWQQVSGEDAPTHRYADAELRRGRYVAHLCETFGVEDFDNLWDKLVEVDGDISLDDYLHRAHQFCFHVRLWEEQVSASDRRREDYMAQQIKDAADRHDGRLLVVTGGFHSSALVARLEGYECIGTDDIDEDAPSNMSSSADCGIAITPYSYERLDNLTGYNSGMPSPGFYDRVWRDRKAGREFSHRPVMADVAKALRKRKQVVSTADLIAVETTAQALASLRGRSTVWRSDLLDAVTGSLVKEEVEYGFDSPFLEEVLKAFRGDRVGRLADDAKLPPLVKDIRERLEQHDLTPAMRPREVDLNLLTDAHDDDAPVSRSRVLHQLRILNIGGFKRQDGTDFSSRTDLTRLWESWRIVWTPDYDAGCVEASRYGTTLSDAARERLLELAKELDRDAGLAARLLLDAALAGVDVINAELERRIEELIRQASDFVQVTKTLGTLLYLYCFDEALGTVGTAQTGRLLVETFQRAVWLLEGLGQISDAGKDVIDGIAIVLRTFERATENVDLDRDEFTDVLHRVQRDREQLPAVRGAVVGVLWTLDEADVDQVGADMSAFSNPHELGDFLTGLFCLAREVAQRHPHLLQSIDEMLNGFTGDEFMEAMPSMRLAFTYFTPREKHHMLLTLFESLGLRNTQPLVALEVDAATAAEHIALEDRVLTSMRKYGLREVPHE